MLLLALWRGGGHAAGRAWQDPCAAWAGPVRSAPQGRGPQPRAACTPSHPHPLSHQKGEGQHCPAGPWAWMEGRHHGWPGGGRLPAGMGIPGTRIPPPGCRWGWGGAPRPGDLTAWGLGFKPRGAQVGRGQHTPDPPHLSWWLIIPSLGCAVQQVLGTTRGLSLPTAHREPRSSAHGPPCLGPPASGGRSGGQ